MALDEWGNLFVSDNGIRRIDAGADGLLTGLDDEVITTVRGGLGGTSLVFDTDGGLLVPGYGIIRVLRRICG